MARSGATVTNQSNDAPVGAVIASMLTLAQFQTQNGTGWILADGSNVAGSKYATITGSSTVPDLRGVVLRGKNNGRADGNQNPDGDLGLGTFQGHATSRNGLGISDPGHSHHVPWNTSASECGCGGGQWSLYNPDVYGDNSGRNTGAVGTGVGITTGDNETRMRNVTVNHFIRIN